MHDSKYIGLDQTLVDQMYFSREESKAAYIKKVEKFLSKLAIKEGDDRLMVLNKVGNAESDLPLLPDIFAFTDELQYSKFSERGRYYSDVKLFEFNLSSKQEQSVDNFDFEEQILSKLLMVELTGYARLDLTFQMGKAYAEVNRKNKRDYYFNLLRLTLYDISPTTVSEFYRTIAEIYLEEGDKEGALSWFKAGVALNSRLSVKKIIKHLENQ
jgi:hypothetical protein